MLMAGVVIANSVVIGLELELAGSGSWVFSIVNNGFLLIYMCPLAPDIVALFTYATFILEYINITISLLIYRLCQC